MVWLVRLSLRKRHGRRIRWAVVMPMALRVLDTGNSVEDEVSRGGYRHEQNHTDKHEPTLSLLFAKLLGLFGFLRRAFRGCLR